MADSARLKKAKMDMLMAADEVSVNILSAPSLILFVIGIAEDTDDIKRYATICRQKNLCQSSSIQSQFDKIHISKNNLEANNMALNILPWP